MLQNLTDHSRFHAAVGQRQRIQICRRKARAGFSITQRLPLRSRPRTVVPGDVQPQGSPTKLGHHGRQLAATDSEIRHETLVLARGRGLVQPRQTQQ